MSAMKRTAHIRGIVSGMATAVCYGANPLFAIPLLTVGISVNSILFYRYFIATLIYGAFLTLIKRRSLKITIREFIPLLFLALFFSFSSITLFKSFQYIDVGISCTLLFAYPSLVAIISCLFFKERLTPRMILAISIATSGAVLLSKGDSQTSVDPRGIVLALASALLYALYIVGVRHFKSIKQIRNDKLNFYVMFLGLIVYICNLRFCTELQALPNAYLWGCALFLALIPTIISLETLTIAIKLIGPTKTAILGALEPLTAIIIGVTLFGEQLTWRICSGFSLIVIGVLLIITRASKANAN